MVLAAAFVGGVAGRSAVAAPEPYAGGTGRKIIDPLPLEQPSVPKVRRRTNNEIDNFIAAGWVDLGITPANLTGDMEFARRVYLDIAGVIPTEGQLRSFRDTSVNRREKLVDTLLASTRYADHWSTVWGDLLREVTNIRGAKPFAFRDYIRNSLRENKPYDQWVREMIAASGTVYDDPGVMFALRSRADADELTIGITQVFLGVQLKCAQCHDHPFEPWKQDDYNGMRDFVGDVRTRRVASEEVQVGNNVVTRPVFEVFDGGPGDGRFMTGAKSFAGRGRAGLADLVTQRQNPYFARVAVNRVWAKLFGEGIVHPPDAFSVENPPSHAALLDWLAVEFIEHGYDLKHIIRLICNSRTYQLASYGGRRPAEVPERGRFFERMGLRRMTAEQLHDSVLVSSGLTMSGRRRDTPAIERRYPPRAGSFLNTLGCHDRQTISERVTDATIQQALALLNGGFLNRAVRMHETHPVRIWLTGGVGHARAVERLFMHTLGREPSAREKRWAVDAADSEAGWSDLHWALINTREFMFIR